VKREKEKIKLVQVFRLARFYLNRVVFLLEAEKRSFVNGFCKQKILYLSDLKETTKNHRLKNRKL